MKIAVATTNGGLEDNVSPVFGRCRTYTFVDIEGKEIKNAVIEENQFASAMGGAGIQAAQFVVNKGVEAVIAGNFGPNVTSVLSQSNVKMISAQGNVRDVITKYLDGNLISSTPQTTFGVGGGRGMGLGRGIGRGMGRGMGFVQQTVPISKEQETTTLKKRMERIEEELDQIKKMLEGLKKK